LVYTNIKESVKSALSICDSGRVDVRGITIPQYEAVEGMKVPFCVLYAFFASFVVKMIFQREHHEKKVKNFGKICTFAA